LLNTAPRWTRSRWPGCLYSAARAALTPGAPEEPALALLERLEGAGYRIDDDEQLRSVNNPQMFAGPVGVVGVSTIPEHGLGLRAFPFARKVPGHLNLRFVSHAGWAAVRQMLKIWRGQVPESGIADLFITSAKLSFSRPMQLQIAGEEAGERDCICLSVAPAAVEVLDWDVASAAIRLSAP
jgi:hypothetical protein